MAHYAFIDENNIVTDVIVGRDEDDLAEDVTSWEDYYSAVRGQRCLQTSYNTHGGVHSQDGLPFRKNYAGIGFLFDEERDAFIPPQPFDSWLLDEETCLWVPPIAMPEEPGPDGELLPFVWDEDSGDWVAVETSGA